MNQRSPNRTSLFASRFSLPALGSLLFAWRFPLVLALLPFVVFLPLTLAQQTWYVHDIQHYFFTYHTASANLLRSGMLPLWNPYAFSGIPMLGDGQTAMFYPPNWSFFLFPGAAALNYAILLQFSIAGVGMYCWARRWELGRWPACMAALAFMFGGMITARVIHLSIMSGVALVPWLVMCVDQALDQGGGEEEKGRRESIPIHPSFFMLHPSIWFLAASVVVALQVFAGHPQVPVYTAVALGVLAILRAVEACIARRQWQPLVMVPLRLVGIYVLGYGLAAIQLVPWVELGLASPRAAGASFEFVMGSGAAGSDWLLWLFPFVYGAQHVGLFADTPMSIRVAVRTWEHSAYVGVPTIGFALVSMCAFAASTWALLSRRARLSQAEMHRWWTTLFLISMVVLGIVVGAGKYTPFAKLVYMAPVVGKLRAVERALVLAAFALPLLAGFGAQWLAEGRASQRIRTYITLGVGTILATTVGFWIWFAAQVQATMGANAGPEQLQLLALNRANAVIPLVLAVATVVVLIRWAFRPPGKRGTWPLVGLVFVDMAIYALSFNPTTSAQVYAYQPEVLQALQGDGQPFRKATVLLNTNELPLPAAQETLAVSWGMVYGVEDINGFNSLQPRRYTDYLFGSDQDDVSYGYLVNQNLLQPDSPILSSLNVRYVLVPKSGPQPIIGSQLVPRYNNTYVQVYENTNVWPRAFFPATVRGETDPKIVLQTVTASGFDGRKETLLESATIPTLATGSTANVQIRRFSAGRIELTTQTSAPRLLVLSDMYFPGWHASIDGADVPIERANYLFRAVVVPAGEHTIVFNYLPLSAIVGLAISLVASAIAGLLFVRALRRQRLLSVPPARSVSF